MYRVTDLHVMAADEATTVANLRYGGSGQPQDNQAHLNDLQNLANMMEALPRRGNTAGWHSMAVPWPTALDVTGTAFQSTN